MENKLKKFDRDNFKNINLKIGGAFFTVFALLIGILILITTYLFHNVIESSENRLSQNITNVLSISISRISFSGKYHAQIFSDQLIEKEDSLKYIVILDASGDIISKSYNPEYQEFIENKHLNSLKSYTAQISDLNKVGNKISYVACCDNQTIKEIAMPYYGSFDQGQIGVIVAGISTFTTHKDIARSRFILMLLGVFVTIVGVIIIYVVTNYISYPIIRLATMFQGILEFAPISVMVNDKNGRTIAISDEFKNKFLDKADEFVDVNQATQLFKGPDLEKMLIDVPTHHEGILTYLTLKFPLFDSLGKFYGVCGIATDVTERERFQKALLKSEADYRSIYETSPVGILNIGPNGRFLRCNRAFEEFVGYTEAELIAFSFIKTTHPEDVEISAQEMKALVTGDKPNVSFEKRFIRKDGQTVWGHVSASVLRNEKDEFIKTISIIENITERKLAEAARDKLLIQEQVARLEAQKAVNARDEFLSIASHELKTPLTTLALQTQLLNRLIEQGRLNTLSKEKQQDMLRISRQHLERLSLLIDSLLDVSRIGAGKLALQKVDINLYDLLNDIIQHFQMEFKEKGCAVSLVGDTKIVGHWDKLRLEQVIVNLISNAIKFGAGKPIAVKVFVENGKAKFTVRDMGIGISKENQNRIFERFERAVSVNSFGGLGLGLYIVKELVETHGGHISVESELGEGATFVVELPLNSPED
ncbi:PAS domain S-box protein [Pseudobdellovibrio sp. HCB154]|uniref:sensor histidine kinase n=1 Tax=Pseudobdellovibrio sp. HCB154 TaxID=3386277 RepID=UPI0039171290